MFPNGSEWIKCDLHIHSPASYDYKDPTVTCQQIVDQIKKEGLSLVSITDHWKVNNIDEIADLAKKIGITVLPGFEFRIDKGDSPLHAIALFPEGTKAKDIEDNVLNHFALCEKKGDGVNDSSLIKLGKSRLTGGKSDKDYIEEGLRNAYVDLKDAREIVINNGGLIYLHYDKKNGLCQIDSKEGSQLKVNIHKQCHIFDLSKANVKEESLKHPDVMKLTGGQAPGLMGSDAHTVIEIGQKYSWIKAKPTFNGLKQIMYEPDSRVCLEKNYPKYIHYRIKTLSLKKGQTNNGKYCFQDIKNVVTFSPNLTAVIGARGSGKSTLVEFMAYVFDLHRKTAISEGITSTIEYHQEQCPDLEVSVSVMSGEDEYNITRVLNQDTPSLSDSGAVAISIDYWPQGRIENIARDKNKVSELMYQKLEDIKLKELWESIETLLQELEQHRLDYVQIYKHKVDELKIKKELQEIELYFKKLKDRAFQDLYKKLQNLYKNKRSVDDYLASLTQYAQKITSIEGNLSGLSKISNSTVESLIPSLKNKLPVLDDLWKSSLDMLDTQITSAKKAVEESSEYKQIISDFDTTETSYHQYCIDQGIKITKEEIQEKRDRQTTLEASLKQVTEDIDKCEAEKSEHYKVATKLSTTFNDWEKANQEVIDKFNNNYSTSQISAIYEQDVNKQIQWIIEQFADSYTDWRESCEEKIIGLEKFQEDYLRQTLREIFDKKNPLSIIIKSLEDMKPTKGGSSFLDGIYKIKETASLRDKLLLRLKEYAIQGLNIVKYKGKPLEALSFGERCGTLLELVLSSGNNPLVIDQPEDHIDTEFLTKRLIPLIKLRKENRQIILCTRDPNLVVLADSELVIVLKDDNKDDVTEEVIEGAIEDSGMEGHICNILEGGTIAFQKREERYAPLYKNAF